VQRIQREVTGRFQGVGHNRGLLGCVLRYRLGSKAEGHEIRETPSGLEYEALIFN
jgi:hypothetical protein